MPPISGTGEGAGEGDEGPGGGAGAGVGTDVLHSLLHCTCDCVAVASITQAPLLASHLYMGGVGGGVLAQPDSRIGDQPPPV